MRISPTTHVYFRRTDEICTDEITKTPSGVSRPDPGNKSRPAFITGVPGLASLKRGFLSLLATLLITGDQFVAGQSVVAFADGPPNRKRRANGIFPIFSRLAIRNRSENGYFFTSTP